MTNAEKYKTAEERSNAFDAFCTKTECADCICQASPAACRYTWLDLTAKETEPRPCPFCGAGVEARLGTYGWVVECEVCGAKSSPSELKAGAIAAWNRRTP